MKCTLPMLLGSLLFLCSNTAAEAVTLATVQINDPSTWSTFAVPNQMADASTGTGPVSYWNTIPVPLNSGTLTFDYLTVDPNKSTAVQYGKLDFTVMSTGPVWMLTTTRFGGGGDSSGDWLSEVSTEQQLEDSGWSVIDSGIVSEYGYGTPGTNSSTLDWLLFELQGTAGENFSIRTEKYQAPIILQGTFAVPEPTSLSLFALASLSLLVHRRRR